MRANGTVVAILSIFVVTLILQYGLIYTYMPGGREMTSQVATIKFCNNRPPMINNTCPNSTYDLVSYSCNVSISNADNDPLIYTSDFISGQTFFNITQTGLISFNVNYSYMGNYTILITVDDSSTCGNGIDTDLFHFQVMHLNHRPILVNDIPDQSGYIGESFGGIVLDNYFMDPDGDELDYEALNTMEHISVVINSITHEISFFPESGWNGTEYIVFQATDPFDLSEESNNVSITIRPRTSSQPAATSSSSGGGGKSGSPPSCLPHWYCSQWGPCEPDNLRKRECSDLNNCSSSIGKPNVTEACIFLSTCYDGFKGQGEEGIDCGGVCPSCGTCYDNLCNNKEDCLKDKSLLPDCGGSCKECTGRLGSCYDGVCNNDEDCVIGLTDIPDCGGSCGKCPTIEEARNQGFNWGLAMIVFMTLLLVSYIGKKTFPFLIIFFKRRKKKQYEDRLMLDAKITESIMGTLAQIEAMLERNEEINKIVIMFSELVRRYFKSLFELGYEFTFEEIINEIKSRNISPAYKNILKYFFERSTEIEYSGEKVQKEDLKLMIVEFRTILSLSSMEPLQVDKSMVMKTKPNLLEKCFRELTFAETALRKKDLNNAYKLYLELYGDFGKLSKEDKVKVYGFLQKLYEEIRTARIEYAQVQPTTVKK